MTAEELRQAGIDATDLEEALALFQQAAALAPDDVSCLHSLSLGLEDVGRRDEAVAVLDRALALAPDDGDCHHARGHLLYHLGRDSEAEEALERALSLLRPDDEQRAISALFLAHIAHDRRDWAEAVRRYDRVDEDLLARWPAWRRIQRLAQRGWCRLQAGDRDGALTDLRAALVAWTAEGVDEADLPDRTELLRAARGALPEIGPDVVRALQHHRLPTHAFEDPGADPSGLW